MAVYINYMEYTLTIRVEPSLLEYCLNKDDDFFVAPNKHLAGFVGSFGEVLSSIGLILYNDLSVNITYQEDNR